MELDFAVQVTANVGLEAAVANEPLHERRWAQLMLPCTGPAARPMLSGLLPVCVRPWLSSCGINPSAELVELERSVLAQSADLDYRPLSGLTTPLASPIPRGLGFEPSAVGEQAYRDASDGVARLAAVRSTGGAERSHNLPTPQPAHVPQHLCGPGSRARRGRLAGTVLVTVTGAGGSGKTRLAVAVAARHLEEQGGRAFFVDLAPVVEPGQVAAALASVLGVREQAGRPVLDVLCEALSGQDILVVVDNCEHVIGAAAELGERLNRACPKLRLLATSHEPLGIEGERVYRLAPLGLPPEDATSLEDLERSDAVKLFVERAGSHDSTFILEEPVAKLVASICRRLDGIPLALELAAARIAGMSLIELDDRLDQRFRLLTGGSRTALPRQRTLQAAFDWSFELLSPRSRRC